VPPKRVQSESHKKTAVGEKKCKKLAGKIIIISRQLAFGMCVSGAAIGWDTPVRIRSIPLGRRFDSIRCDAT